MPVALDKRAVAGSRNHVQLHSCTFLVEDKPRKIIRLYAFGYMLQLGKSWACKHWKFQNNYFVIFFAFGFVILDLCCHFFVIFLSFLCHFCVIFCHLFVILLSFYCHFGNGKMEKKNCLKMTTMTDLLLSRGSTKYKEQVEKLLESQPAVKKDRAGELALGNSFLGLPGRGVVSRLAVQGRLKNRVGGRGRGEMARGAAQAREAGPTCHLLSHFFFIFLSFFCRFLVVFYFLALFIFLSFSHKDQASREGGKPGLGNAKKCKK